MDSETKSIQIQRVFKALSKAEPMTRLQVAEQTNIRRANVCWYIRDFKKHSQVAVVKKGIDPITKHKAEFLTTNPDLFPEDNQTNLFSNGMS